MVPSNSGERQTHRGPDDWFEEPEPAPPRRPAAHRALQVDPDAPTHEQTALPLDDWLASEPPSPSTRPTTAHTAPAATTHAQTPNLVLPKATLKLGDSGPAVKELQRALTSLGYASGKADGDFGSSTQRALMTFQTAHQLAPDGVLGPATRAALVKALSSRG
jgi:peptidoglycan hydrolase-like protein with peptidoglycan-binding domain